MKKEKMVGFELRSLSIMIKRYMGSHKDDLLNNSQCEMPRGHDEHHSHHGHHGATHMHMMVLGYLFENQDRDIFQKDLEKEFSVRRPTATNMLKRMEKQGLITREPVPGDARLKKLVLTKKAVEFSNGIKRKTDDFEKKLINGLTDEEIGAFLSAIEKMKKNLEG